jgi:hypothetical protein
MVNLAELDTSFLVPCRHCAALLQEWERFCPSCGKEQSVADDAGDARSAVEPGRGTSARGEALAPIAADSAILPWQEVREAIGHPVPKSAAEEVNSEIGLVRPGAFWQKEVLAGRGSEHWAGSSVTRNRLLISIVAVLVLLALALALDHAYLDKHKESDKLRQFEANVAQVQSALSRGDLSAAGRLLNVLDADHADDPGVQALREAFDRRVLEQAAKRAQLRDAALKASKALGFDEPAAPPAQAPSPPKPPMVARPAPGIGVADPKGKECNETLVALALCPKR